MTDGRYFASLEFDGGSVSPVPQPKLQTITVTKGGTYYPSEGFDGFSSFVVNLQNQDDESQDYPSQEQEVEIIDNQHFEKGIHFLGQYDGNIYIYCDNHDIYKLDNNKHLSTVYTPSPDQHSFGSNYVGFNSSDGSFIIQKSNNIGEQLTYWYSNDFSEEIQISGLWDLNNYSNFLPYYTYPSSYTYCVVNRGQITFLETCQYIDKIFQKDNYFFMFGRVKNRHREFYVFKDDGTPIISEKLISDDDSFNIMEYCQPLYNGKFLTIKPTILNSGTADASYESRVYIYDSNGLNEEHIASFEGLPSSDGSGKCASFYYHNDDKSYAFFRTTNGFIKIDIDTGETIEITDGFATNLPQKSIIQIIRDETQVGYYYFITKQYYCQRNGQEIYRYDIYFIDLINNTSGLVIFN